MKFGKTLRRMAHPVYREHYLNYKQLKKLLKRLLEQVPTSATRWTASPTTVTRVRTYAEFYFVLSSELEKVDALYAHEIARLAAELRAVEAGLDETKAAAAAAAAATAAAQASTGAEIKHGEEVSRDVRESTTAALAAIRGGLESLRSFSAMNYLACDKIVKKADKVLHLRSRDEVMAAVQQRTFHRSLDLATLLTEVDLRIAELAGVPAAELAERFECPVCRDVLRSPVVLSCAHRFCWQCLEDSARLAHVQACAVCRKPQPLDPSLYTVDGGVSAFIAERLGSLTSSSAPGLAASNSTVSVRDDDDDEDDEDDEMPGTSNASIGSANDDADTSSVVEDVEFEDVSSRPTVSTLADNTSCKPSSPALSPMTPPASMPSSPSSRPSTPPPPPPARSILESSLASMSGAGSRKIHFTYSMSVLERHAEAGTLFVLDLDETVIASSRGVAMLSPPGLAAFEELLQTVVPPRFHRSLCVALQRALDVKVPVEGSLTADVVRRLQDAGGWVMGLTARPSKLAMATAASLAAAGIDLTRNSPLQFSQQVLQDPDTGALFTNGVVFAHTVDKGVVLDRFLGQAIFRRPALLPELAKVALPRAIVFMDDRLYNVVAVRDRCLFASQHGIPLHCYHFAGDAERPHGEIDLDVLRAQLRVFVATNGRVIWTDDEVRSQTPEQLEQAAATVARSGELGYLFAAALPKSVPEAAAAAIAAREAAAGARSSSLPPAAVTTHGMPQHSLRVVDRTSNCIVS